jgi:hypothetical protein
MNERQNLMNEAAVEIDYNSQPKQEDYSTGPSFNEN